jgi:eukaryotic-like serine/threonine-protein kinase
VEQEKAQLQASMLEMGNSADETERELIRLATLFCEPLRGRPELGNLFLELESAAAALIANLVSHVRSTNSDNNS